MDSLGIKEFERDFPLGDGVDLLDFELGGDEIGGDTKKSDFFKGSSSDYSSGSGGGGGGGLFGPAEQEEELEWLTEFPDVPDVGFNILDDVKPGFIDIGFPGQQHSPVSVLENNNSGGSTDKKTTTTKTTTPFVGSITPLKVPSGFPVFVRKKRVFRKRRLGGFGQEHYKHLFLAGVSAAHEQQLDAVRSSSVKIVRKNRGAATGGRRCLHCGSDKTPQWRTGPSGKKTLCNACGVRYKSGRLVPEYRPANSPTFTPVLHSNSHRKIMEMRRKKEDGGGIGQMMMINGTF